MCIISYIVYTMSSETAEKQIRAINRYNDRVARGLKTALGNFSRVFMNFHQRELKEILHNEKRKLLRRVATDFHLNLASIEARYLRGEMNEGSDENSCSRDTIEEGKIAVSSKGKHALVMEENPDDVDVNEYEYEGVTYYYKDMNDGEVFIEANDDIKIVGVYNRKKKHFTLENGAIIPVVIKSSNKPIGNIAEPTDSENVFIENTVEPKKERKPAGRKKKVQSPNLLSNIVQVCDDVAEHNMTPEVINEVKQEPTNEVKQEVINEVKPESKPESKSESKKGRKKKAE